MGDGMAESNILVSLGKEKLEIEWTEGMTFGELRKIAEERTGSVEGGLRLLHKGKFFPDSAILGSVGVKSGTKIMAMRTKKQIDAAKDLERRKELANDRADMARMMDKSNSQRAGSSSETSEENKSKLLGDDLVEGQTGVFLIKGRSKYRVNIDLSSSVLTLKERASTMEGIKADPRDMKLLFKGKFLEDSKSLVEYGTKDAASFMLMFSARYHDAKEDCAEIGSIEKKVMALEGKAKSLSSKVKHRFLDSVDLTIARGEVEEELLRLKDNLISVKSEDSRRGSLVQKLSEIETLLASLQ